MTNPEKLPTYVAPSTSPPKRRHGWRIVLVALLALLVVVAGLPYLLSWTPLRNWALQAATHQVHGTVSTSDASFDWFSPPVVHGLEIRSLDDKPVVTIAAIELDK